MLFDIGQHDQRCVVDSKFGQEIRHAKVKTKQKRRKFLLIKISIGLNSNFMELISTYFLSSISSSNWWFVSANIRILQRSNCDRNDKMYGIRMVRPPSSYNHHTSMVPLWVVEWNMPNWLSNSFGTVVELLGVYERFGLRMVLCGFVFSLVWGADSGDALAFDFATVKN